MIAKGKSISSGKEAVNYALGKDGHEIIDKNHIVGNNGLEVKKEFALFQDLNTRCTNKDMHFVLSPEKAEGKKLTNEDYTAISKSFLEKMGLKDHQSITVKHTDADHIHLHLVVNRINAQGRALNDSKISLKAQDVAEKIAIERGLVSARTVRDFNLENTKEIRQQIKDKHLAVMQHRPRNFEEYKDLMKSSGVEIKPSVTPKGALMGFRVEYQGNSFKASEIDRKMSLNKLSKTKETLRMNHNPEFTQTPQKKLVLEKDQALEKREELKQSKPKYKGYGR